MLWDTSVEGLACYLHPIDNSLFTDLWPLSTTIRLEKPVHEYMVHTSLSLKIKVFRLAVTLGPGILVARACVDFSLLRTNLHVQPKKPDCALFF